MERIDFVSPEGEETLSFYVVEKAELAGQEYLLVTEEEEGDAEAYVLKQVAESSGEEATYEFVEDDRELDAVSALFQALMEDTDVTT